MTNLSSIFPLLGHGLYGALRYWWAWLPVVLGVVAYRSWFDAKRAVFLAGLKWTLLEIIPPPEVPYSSPKAADSFFSGLHATYAGFPGTSWKGQFFQGKVPVWFSFEIVSDGGVTHFYIRCQEEQRNVIESLLFAQYPQAEIRVVPDYITELPASFDPEGYDVSGAELEFTKDQAYPIKTYEDFEEGGGKDEYARLDPLAPLMEIMSALQPGEHLWLQFLVRATGGAWADEQKKVVDKIIGKEAKKAESPFAGVFKVIDGLVGIPVPEKKEEKKEDFNLQKLTPAQKVVLEQVEYKLAKLAFKSGIRLLYTARKDAFNGSRIASVTGMFKQLYYTNLNSFKPSSKTGTRDKGVLKWMFPGDIGFFSAERALKKKKKMYGAYRERTFPEFKNEEIICILTTQELATLWHLPGLNVKAPLMPRVQAKKGQPPAILPTR